MGCLPTCFPLTEAYCLHNPEKSQDLVLAAPSDTALVPLLNEWEEGGIQ